jgi:hypothetical protein
MMKQVKQLKISSLVLDYDLYPRVQIQSYHVNEMARALEAGVELPPIIVDRKSKRVVDGFHRVKAYQKVYGLDAKIPAILKDYESEVAMYLDAISLNAAHGRPLSTYDKARCIARADELKLEPAVIAKALNTTLDRVIELKTERFALYEQKPIALKMSTAHLAGEELTKEQVNYNVKAGGMNQTFYINQVIAMLESDAVDWDNQRVVNALKRLHGLLDEALKPVGV